MCVCAYLYTYIIYMDIWIHIFEQGAKTDISHVCIVQKQDTISSSSDGFQRSLAKSLSVPRFHDLRSVMTCVTGLGARCARVNREERTISSTIYFSTALHLVLSFHLETRDLFSQHIIIIIFLLLNYSPLCGGAIDCFSDILYIELQVVFNNLLLKTMLQCDSYTWHLCIHVSESVL